MAPAEAWSRPRSRSVVASRSCTGRRLARAVSRGPSLAPSDWHGTRWTSCRLTGCSLRSFTRCPPPPPPARHHDEILRRHCEEDIRRLADDGAGVILGRGAAVALGKDLGFHVRLDGPPGRRVIQGAVIEGVSEEEAGRHLQTADRARTAYVRRLYRADPTDPRYYHLTIDSTAIPLDTVTEIILLALSSFPARLT